MGQYHHPVCIEAEEGLSPHSLGCGLKEGEQGFTHFVRVKPKAKHFGQCGVAEYVIDTCYSADDLAWMKQQYGMKPIDVQRAPRSGDWHGLLPSEIAEGQRRVIVNLDTLEYLDPARFGQVPTLAGMVSAVPKDRDLPIMAKAAKGNEVLVDIAGALFVLLSHPERRGGGDPATVEAHLFPRALSHDIRGAHKHLFVGAAATPGRRIVQAGLFDREIWCSTHEAAFGLFDDYGIDFSRNFVRHCRHPAPNIWQITPVDSDKLVRFWLAILWRFSVSDLPEAALVDLGPYESLLRDILFSNAPCNVEPAIFMLRYRSRVMRPENICFTPYLSAFPGLPLRHRAYGMDNCRISCVR
jgi:hypothetical protein